MHPGFCFFPMTRFEAFLLLNLPPPKHPFRRLIQARLVQAGVNLRRLDALVVQRFGDLLDREAQVEHAHSAGMACHVAGEVFFDAQWLGDLLR